MADRVTLVGQPAKTHDMGDAWVVELPRFGPEGTHYHTYGLLTPYFKGLAEGKLLGTRCTNRACPVSQGRGELWLPPRADCPDCHQPMAWGEIATRQGTSTPTPTSSAGAPASRSSAPTIRST